MLQIERRVWSGQNLNFRSMRTVTIRGCVDAQMSLHRAREARHAIGAPGSALRILATARRSHTSQRAVARQIPSKDTSRQV